jgi:uncharacterized coiled-coil protein SlyX
MNQPLTTAAVAAFAGLLGYAVHAGIWTERVDQILAEHERRLNAQSDRLKKLEEVATETKSRLSTIEAQLSFLVRNARADEHPTFEPR